MSNFDFLAAINGEPIYCKLDYKLITPYYSISEKQFLWGGAIWSKNGNAINSIAFQLYGNLTTDPPKKKVKKTVWVSIIDIGQSPDYGTSSAYRDKETAESHSSKNAIGTYPIEIEVEE